MEASLQSIADHLPELIAITDPAGNIRFLNQTACRILGFTCTDQLTAAGLFTESFRKTLPGVLQSACRNGFCHHRATLLASDGRKVPVVQKIIAHRNNGGEIDAYSYIAEMASDPETDRSDAPNHIDGRRLIDITRDLLAADCRDAVIQSGMAAARLLTGSRLAIFCAPAGNGQFRISLHSKDASIPQEQVDAISSIINCNQMSRFFEESIFFRLMESDLDHEPALFALKKCPIPVRELIGTLLVTPQKKLLGLILIPLQKPARLTREDKALLIQLGALISVALQNHAASEYSDQLAKEMTQVFSALHDAVVVLSRDGMPVMANPAAIRMLGIDPTGQPMETVIDNLNLKHMDGSPVLYDEMPIKRAFEGESVNSACFRFIDAGNRIRTYSISAFPLSNSGDFTGAVCVARDDTRKEELMTRLEQERSALKAIINSAPETILVVDENCRIAMSNPEAERLYGKPIPHGKPFESHADLKLRHPDGKIDSPVDSPLSRTVFQGEVIQDLEMDIELPDGNLRHVLVNTSPIRNHKGKITGGVGIIHDITTRKKEKLELQRIQGELENRVRLRTMELSHTVDALKVEIEERIRIEKKLRRSEAKLRDMSKRMLHALEADRQTVAKELHDSIGASLAAIKFSLEEKLTRMTQTPPTDLISLEKIVSYLMQTIKETKRISANLRPTTLDELGLPATISWFCREFKAFYKQIQVNPYIEINDQDLSDSIKIVIYRILQEAMNNAAKHGAPGKIDLVLTRTGEHILLHIEDDGVGFEPGTGLISQDPLSGHGLQGMRERAEICGGTFSIESSPGIGTRITVTMPLSEAT